MSESLKKKLRNMKKSGVIFEIKDGTDATLDSKRKYY